MMKTTKVLLFHLTQSVVRFTESYFASMVVHSVATRLAVFAIYIVFAFSFSSQVPSSSRQTILSKSILHSSVNTKESAEDRRKQSRKQNDPLISLNLNLDAMAQSAAAPVAQELLQRIHALHKEGYYEVSPDIVSYNSVLKAWKEDNNPQKAYAYLKQMLDRDDSDKMKPDVISFNTVILAFAKKGNHKRARHIIQTMKVRDDYPNPDTLTYNALLYALAQSKARGTTKEADDLLREMINNKYNVPVDTTSFNTVIHAWSQGANKFNVKAAHRAQQLFDEMEELALAGNTSVRPDLYTYTTLIQAWARCEQALRCQKLLDSMTLKGLLPNRITYTAVMSSLAKAGKPEKAERILNSMMMAYQSGNLDLKPDTVSFSSVMDGWARLSHVDKPYAADRALALLERMKALEKEGMGPNARTYTSVLSAVAKSGTWEACEDARKILQSMEEEYRDGNESLKPTAIHYNTVLHAYARSPRADKALKAAIFLKGMKRHPDPNCHPDTISYNSLLMSCANAFGNEELKQRSFSIAMKSFQTVMYNRGKVRPTSTTFVHFCKASRRLVNRPQQKVLLQKTLKLCCDRGMLNHVVVLQAQQACKTEDEWREIGGEVSEYVGKKDKLDASQVPETWIRYAGR